MSNCAFFEGSTDLHSVMAPNVPSCVLGMKSGRVSSMSYTAAARRWPVSCASVTSSTPCAMGSDVSRSATRVSSGMIDVAASGPLSCLTSFRSDGL